MYTCYTSIQEHLFPSKRKLAAKYILVEYGLDVELGPAPGRAEGGCRSSKC